MSTTARRALVRLLVGLLVAVLALASAGSVGAQETGPPEPTSPQEAGVGPGAAPTDPRGDDAFASPEVAALQRRAGAVQDELSTLQDQVRTAQGALDTARAALAAAESTLAEAAGGVSSGQSEVDAYTRSVFTDLGPPSAARLLLTADGPDSVLDGLDLVAQVRAEQNELLISAMAARGRARGARDVAAQHQAVATAAAAALATQEGDARGRAGALSADLGRALSEVDTQVVALQQAQAERNDQTSANWQAYLDRLAAAGIAAPPAVDLRDPARLPAGLTPLAGADGRPQAGVAQAALDDGAELLVLSAEAQNAVTVAIGSLGLPYSPSGAGPRSFSCGGLVSVTSTQAGLPLPATPAAQLAVGVPVPAADTQPGDLLFVGPAADGVQSVAYVLDARTVLTADARTTAVVVADRPPEADVLGAARPTLGVRPAADVPQPQPGRAQRRCGGVVSTGSTGSSGSSGGSLAWGGFPNGLIPGAALCSTGLGRHGLRCDAAQTIAELSGAYQQSFGTPLCITDSYRPYAEQIDLYSRKPGLAAVPGTSNHGWGMAVDLCGGIDDFGSAPHEWMRANAGAFGWVHPSWARQGGGREEPWHWEFAG